MRTKQELWTIVETQFKNDLLIDEESHCICDVILSIEPDHIGEDEMNSLLQEMKDYAQENNLKAGAPFWEVEDIDSRLEFIATKIAVSKSSNIHSKPELLS